MERARIARQPAHLLLASEFGSATLHEKGSGEYDPSFIITKLGAKVNRVVAAGLLERLEQRETSNGATLFQGQLRDPTGLHYFSVGDYNSEMMRELSHQWVERLEDGEPLLVMMTAKTRWYQTDEGAVYTSLRPEEACVVSREVYANWLLDACESTMQRMNAYTASMEVEPTVDAFARAELPSSLLVARNHYGEVDLEPFKLNLMQALDIAEGRLEAATTPPPMMSLPAEPGTSSEVGTDGTGESDVGDEMGGFLVQVIGHLDQGEGVDFDTVLKNAVARGYVRELAESVLDELLESGQLEEPRFGWFKLAAAE
jgi:RPA family protein